MERGFLVVVVCALAVACGGAEVTALSAENARLRAQLDAQSRDSQPLHPIGDIFVPKGQRIELGWLDLQVAEIASCGPGKVGVALEIINRTDEPLDVAGLGGKLLDPSGAAAEEAYDFQHCTGGDLDIAAGGKTLRWFKFDGKVARADLLELEVVQPEGLARYRLLFALRKTTKRPELRAQPKRDELGKITAKAGPLETSFYRFAVTNVKICEPPATPDAPLLVGVEVVLDNLSNVPFTIDGDATLRDGRGFVYDAGFLSARGACTGSTIGYQELRPGDRVRGLLRLFEVPAGAGALVLDYTFRGVGYQHHPLLRLSIGTLPPPPAKPQPTDATALSEWVAPKVATASAAGVHITVKGLAPCKEELAEGRMELGVDLLIENRSDKEVEVIDGGEIEDAEHYRHQRSFFYQPHGPCHPRLSLEKPLKPGDSVRGWINAFTVPVKARGLKLHYDIAVLDPNAGYPIRTGHALVIDLGRLRSQ